MSNTIYSWIEVNSLIIWSVTPLLEYTFLFEILFMSPKILHLLDIMQFFVNCTESMVFFLIRRRIWIFSINSAGCSRTIVKVSIRRQNTASLIKITRGDDRRSLLTPREVLVVSIFHYLLTVVFTDLSLQDSSYILIFV
jgi:hypothetical protein